MSRKRKKKIKRDYQRKKLQNPFFGQKKGSNKHYWWPKYLFLIISLILILLIWFFLFSSFWHINNINIEGLTRFPKSEIEKYLLDQERDNRWLVFKQTNIFLFNKDSVRQNIAKNYNFFALKIERKLPKTLLVVISERPYAFIFQEKDKYFYSSPEGYILKETNAPTKDNKYFIIENKNEVSLITQKDRVNIKRSYLQFIFKLDKILNKQPNLPIKKFIIDQEFNTIKVKFQAGPVVFFNTKIDAEKQVNRLILVKKEKIKDNFNKVDYIDLRYGDRIFLYPPIN